MCRRIKRAAFLLAAAMLPAIGCVTVNQFQNFLRTEIALIATRVIADPIQGSLEELAAPVLEEIVPSI